MRFLLITLVTAGTCILGACAGREESATPAPAPASATPPSESPGWPATRTTDRGNFEVTIRPESGAIVRNEHFSLEVSLKAKGGGEGNVRVDVDADMPAHQHGMNTKPEVSMESPLRFRADGMLFHMSGDWVITVDVTRGSDSERASFPVSVE